MARTRVHSPSLPRPTRDDVARIANTSGATVSRVFSGRVDFPITDETRAKVLDAARQLGYRPNLAARALIGGRTGSIGFWMDLSYSRYRSHVLAHMRDLLAQSELALAVTDADHNYRLDHSFDRALRIPVDGVIAFDTSDTIDLFGREHDTVAPDMPFVSMGAYWSENQSYVGIDLLHGARLAMDHLLQGHRERIAYVVPADSSLVAQGPRYEAYVEKMKSAGFQPETIAIETGNFASVKKALTERFGQGKRPDALYCMNDEIAVAAGLVLLGMKLTPGKEVALLGFDGIEESEHAAVPITTVRQPVEKMCTTAFKFLQERIADPNGKPSQTVLRPQLIERASTDRVR